LAKSSILICAIFYSAIDIVFTAGNAPHNINTCMGILIKLWGILTLIIFKPQNLAAKNALPIP